MTNGSDDARDEFEEIRRLRAEGLISTEEAYNRVLRASGMEPLPVTPPDAGPTTTETPAHLDLRDAVASLLTRRFVFDGSDGTNGTLVYDGPERLSRLLLFFKWLFCIPLLFWLAIYRAAALVVAFLAFLAILLTGRYPPGLFGFVRGYVASQYRVYSYFPLLLSDHWSAGEKHPLSFTIEPAPRQSRLLLVFVKLPAMILGAFFGIASIGTTILTIFAFPIWFAILFTGRYPGPARRFALSVLQWSARVTAWQFFMSDDWALFGRTMKVRLPAIAAAIIFPVFTIWYTFFGPRADFAFDIFGVNDAKQVVDEFMIAGRDGNNAQALALTDPQTVASSDFTRLLQNRQLFAGYQKISVSGFNREKSTAFGDRIQIQGSVTYSSGPKGTYVAILVKRRGQWLIQTFLLQRPP